MRITKAPILWLKALSFTLIMTILLSPVAGALSPTEPVEIGGVKAALLMESNSGRIVYEHEADVELNAAGLCRLPALLVICEAVDKGEFSLDTQITVSSEAAAVRGPTAFVEANEVISAGDLLKSAVMICAGDAIHALAYTLSGSEKAFVDKVNARLKDLGVTAQVSTLLGENTKFTANQLAAIGKMLAKSKAFTSYSNIYLDGIKHSDGRETELVNYNRLLKNYSGCFGLSTGSSPDAGYCGVFAVTRNNMTYICVIVGAANSSERFSAATALLDYGFSAFKLTQFAEAGKVVFENVPVKGGIRRTVNLICKESVSFLGASAAAYDIKGEAPESIDAPVDVKKPIMTVDILDSEGKKAGEMPLYAQEPVDQAGLFDFMMKVLWGWLYIS